MCSILKCNVLSLKTYYHERKVFRILAALTRHFFLNQECKKLYRKLETTSIKQINASAHRSYNETCLNNKQLSPYTNIYIYTYIKH